MTAGGGGLSPTSSVLQTSNWNLSWYSTETDIGGGQSRYDIKLIASYTLGTVPSGVDVILTIITGMQPDTYCDTSPSGLRELSILVTSGQSSGDAPVATIFQAYQNGNGSSTGVGSIHWP